MISWDSFLSSFFLSSMPHDCSRHEVIYIFPVLTITNGGHPSPTSQSAENICRNASWQLTVITNDHNTFQRQVLGFPFLPEDKKRETYWKCRYSIYHYFALWKHQKWILVQLEKIISEEAFNSQNSRMQIWLKETPIFLCHIHSLSVNPSECHIWMWTHILLTMFQNWIENIMKLDLIV